MKKNLCAVAVLAAMSGAAAAANVELYGIVDMAMSVANRTYVSKSSDTTLALKSGQQNSSRWGIRGSEDIGGGLKVGFSLENGFNADTGTLANDGRMFGRDARLFVEGEQFGLLSVGRMGPIVGGNGPYARFGIDVNPFSCDWGDVGGTLQLMGLGYAFVDNAIAYTTPKFGGFDASLQYSFGTDVTKFSGTATEGKSSVERMAAGALRYKNDRFMVVAGIEEINQAQPAADAKKLDDSISYNLATSYDAGFAKFYAYGQYFQSYAAAAKVTVFGIPSGVDGWGLILGSEIPAFSGKVKLSLGYADFKGAELSEQTMKTWQAAAGYVYPLSKRTSIYTGFGWINSSYSSAYEAAHPAAQENVREFLLGVTHKF